MRWNNSWQEFKKEFYFIQNISLLNLEIHRKSSYKVCELSYEQINDMYLSNELFEVFKYGNRDCDFRKIEENFVQFLRKAIAHGFNLFNFSLPAFKNLQAIEYMHRDDFPYGKRLKQVLPHLVTVTFLRRGKIVFERGDDNNIYLLRFDEINTDYTSFTRSLDVWKSMN